MSKRVKILVASAAAVLALLMVGITVMSAVILVDQAKVNNMLTVYYGQMEDPAQEDDVTIGGQYVIKSTTQISDAYKSGDSSKLDDRDKETLAMATDVIKEIIKDGMSDFEKEEAVYKFLTKGMKATTGILTVINESGGDNDNPHDVLKNRSAVCVGYATTFRLFMQMLGIECKVVHNTSLSHSWDLVRLEDGWYHTDCYMDNDSANYRNFNMSDTTASQTSHEWNREFFPAANGKKFNYVLMHCQEIKDIYAIPKAVLAELKKKNTTFSFTFKDGIKAEDEPVAKYIVEQFENLTSNQDKFYQSTQWTANDKGAYVLCYYITYLGDDNSTLDQKEKDKIDKRISDVLEQYHFFDQSNGVG